MKKFWIVLIVVLAVLAVQWWYVDFSAGTMTSGIGSNTTKSSDVPNKPGLRTYSRIAIVSEPGGGDWKDRLQNKIAKELQRAILISKVAQVHNTERDTWVRIKPTVDIFHSRDEAIKHKPEFVIDVKADEWHCTFLPFYTKWRGGVLVEGTPPAYRETKRIKADGDTIAYCFSIQVMPEGRFSGLCSRSHPVNIVTSAVAKQTADEMVDIVEKAQEESRGRQEKP